MDASPSAEKQTTLRVNSSKQASKRRLTDRPPNITQVATNKF